MATITDPQSESKPETDHTQTELKTPQDGEPSTTTTTITTAAAATTATETSPAESDPQPITTTTAGESDPKPTTATKWPGWPGDCVFRLIVPVTKVGSIIGRKGDLIKKLCDDTRARIRVLDGPVGTRDRVVLISGKEEPEAPISPAMDAAITIFKRVTGLPDGDAEVSGAAAITFCSIQLLVASAQAISLIGKQGSTIKSIQESTKASVRIVPEEEAPFYVATDEKLVDLQGEALNVLKALEATLGHLRKFLVDHSVVPLFEKNHNSIISQEHQVETWADKSVMHTISQGMVDPSFANRGALFLERETRVESQMPPSRNSLYAQDGALTSVCLSALSRAGGPVVSQIVRTMQVPISYAFEIIGNQGCNIKRIRQTSGATIELKEGSHNEILVEIKGTSSQVQIAQQLIEDCLSNGSYSESVTSSYRKHNSGLRSACSQLDDAPYHPAFSLPGQPYCGHRSSDVEGFSSCRI